MLPSRCSQPPCRNWLVMSVAVSRETNWPEPQAAVSSAGTTPHVGDERVERGVAAARQQPELPGPSRDAGDDDPDRDDRGAARRVGVAQRDHGVAAGYGFFVGFGVLVGFGVALGAAEADGAAELDGAGHRRRRPARPRGRPGGRRPSRSTSACRASSRCRS